MKQNKITLYIDLLFCLVFLPMLIKILPVDKWIVHQTTFLLILVAYLYILYFVYRKVKIPSLMMQKKYWQVAVIIIVLLLVTEFITFYREFITVAFASNCETIYTFTDSLVFLLGCDRICFGNRTLV